MKQLIDQFQRRIDYLRISITDRCNLRCRYCMPEAGVEFIDHDEVLRYEEIKQIVEVGAELGIKKIRVTGGEPLVRKGSPQLVEMLAEIPGIEEVALTTNGVLLPQLGRKLARAGLERVNISLDSLEADNFQQITRFNQFDRVWAGIKTALQEDLKPVKLNVVVIKGVNDSEISDFVELTTEYPLHVRFIEFMPGRAQDFNQAEGYISLSQIKERITNKYELQSAQVTGNGPAEYYKIPGAVGTIGFINPISNHFCGDCNRLRLTATGDLKPCLYSQAGFNLREIVRNEQDKGKIAAQFKAAVANKPQAHTDTQDNQLPNHMSQLGG